MCTILPAVEPDGGLALLLDQGALGSSGNWHTDYGRERDTHSCARDGVLSFEKKRENQMFSDQSQARDLPSEIEQRSQEPAMAEVFSSWVGHKPPPMARVNSRKRKSLHGPDRYSLRNSRGIAEKSVILLKISAGCKEGETGSNPNGEYGKCTDRGERPKRCKLPVVKRYDREKKRNKPVIVVGGGEELFEGLMQQCFRMERQGRKAGRHITKKSQATPATVSIGGQ